MKVGAELKKANNGLRLVHVSRNVRRAEIQGVVRVQDTVREGTSGRPVSVPRIWAVAEPAPEPVQAPVQAPVAASQPAPPKLELAFYRKYTEAMLRRYLILSTQVGRSPSLLGRELFRGSASHYTMTTFEDEVVFCVDVERCLAKLRKSDQRIIQRVAIQGYTHEEAAPKLGLSFKWCVITYGEALDRLTEILVAGRLLEPQKMLSRP